MPVRLPASRGDELSLAEIDRFEPALVRTTLNVCAPASPDLNVYGGGDDSDESNPVSVTVPVYVVALQANFVLTASTVTGYASPAVVGVDEVTTSVMAALLPEHAAKDAPA
jgi:hypothetical protein